MRRRVPGSGLPSPLRAPRLEEAGALRGRKRRSAGDVGPGSTEAASARARLTPPATVPPSAAPVARPRTPSIRRRLARSTAHLWRGLSYDDVIAVAAAARELLGLARPRERQRVVSRLTRPELAQLLAHAYRQRGDYGLLVRTLLMTGCRVAEFVALDVEDLDADTPAITIREGKNRKGRAVPILRELAEQLQIHTRLRDTGPLFRTRSWSRFSRRRVQAIVQQLAAGAGLAKRVYPHLLRHSIAQVLLEGGMPLEQVQRFLGHEKIATTEIYARSSPAMIREAYRRALADGR